MQAELHGVIPVTDGRFEPLQQSAVRWSNSLRQAAAVCNGLTLVNKTMVIGEEVEQKLFKLVEARFKARLPSEPAWLPSEPAWLPSQSAWVPSESAFCLCVSCLWVLSVCV